MRQSKKITPGSGKPAAGSMAGTTGTTHPSAADSPPPLSVDEKKRLTECADLIRKGQQTPFQMGQALAEIKLKKLHREYGGFEDYCEAKLDITRVHANRLIKAHECVQNLTCEPIGSVLVPITESQARVIANLANKDQIRVGRKAKELLGDSAPTAKIFEEARAAVLPAKATTLKAAGTPTTKATTPADTITLVQNENRQLLTVSEAVEYARDLLRQDAPKQKIEKELNEALELLQFFLGQLYPMEEAA